MNREMRRASEKEGRRLQKLGWDEFQDVTEEAIKRHLILNRDPLRGRFADKVYKNNKYIVQVFRGVVRKGRNYIKVMIRRSDSEPIYSWQDMYRIKNEVFGEEVEAIQFFPKKSELVDVANLYWFWIEAGEL